MHNRQIDLQCGREQRASRQQGLLGAVGADRSGATGMTPRQRRTLPIGTVQTRALVAATAATIAGRTYEHVGRHHANLRSIVPRQMRAVLARFLASSHHRLQDPDFGTCGRP